MNWQDAIKESKKGSATRIIIGKDGLKRTIIKHSDGSGFCLVSKNGVIDYFLSRLAANFEMDEYLDWEPS